MHSVIERSPPELLHEIILVDDGSDAAHIGSPLEEYVKTLPVRTSKNYYVTGLPECYICECVCVCVCVLAREGACAEMHERTNTRASIHRCNCITLPCPLRPLLIYIYIIYVK